MRISMAVVASSWLACAGCSPPIVTTTVVLAPVPDVASRQRVPPPIAQETEPPDEALPAARPSGGPIVIRGSALERLGDSALAARAIETPPPKACVRGLASIGRRDEEAAREGISLSYAKTPADVRKYILWQYTFVRSKILDEERELARRLGREAQVSGRCL